MTVQLPAGSSIEAKAAAAEFRGVGRLGDVAFDGAHGAVKIDEAASVRLTALAGDVTVGRLTGPADAVFRSVAAQAPSPLVFHRGLCSWWSTLVALPLATRRKPSGPRRSPNWTLTSTKPAND